VPGTESKALGSTIRNLLTPSIILTQNPRTLIQLVVQSLTQAGTDKFQGPLVAAMINASTMALMNAGSIPMRGVVWAVSVGRLRSTTKSSPSLLLDPSDDEIPSLEGGGCFAFLFGTGQKGGSEMVWSNWQSNAPFDEVELLSARELARTGAKKVWMCMKESIGWMGKGKSVAVLEKRSKQEIEEYDSEDENDHDDMEI
jgi:exosome complex component RRP46